MNTFEIFVDSAANLTEEQIKQNNIGVVSFTCLVNGKEHECYEEGKPFAQTAKEFYAEMRAGAEVKTSLVNKDKIIEAVSPVLESGKDVLFVTISANVSGTYAQAVEAAEFLKKQFPERKMLVEEAYNASLGEGMLAVYAAKLRDMGQSIEACAEWIRKNKYKMNSYFTVDDLKYLRRGGRISATLAIAGTILNIKPILKADANGKISFSSKERGRKKALASIAKTFAENVINPENQTVAIAHADCEEDALYLAELLKGYGAQDIVINYYDICTGIHVGPGTVALFFLGKDRRPLEAQEAAERTDSLLKHPKHNQI